jgi:hypothetical protein
VTFFDHEAAEKAVDALHDKLKLNNVRGVSNHISLNFL